MVDLQHWGLGLLMNVCEVSISELPSGILARKRWPNCPDFRSDLKKSNLGCEL